MNAEFQRIARRDPDLMTVMQININDNDITSQQPNKGKKEEPKKEAKKPAAKPEIFKSIEKQAPQNKPAEKKKNYGNLFG